MCELSSCIGNDWYKFREVREPGCHDRKDQPLPDVDISSILSQKPKAYQKQKSIVGSGLRGSLPFPEELYNVPGFVNNVIRFMTESTAYANKGVAFAAALALPVGGRVKWPGNRLRNATGPLIPPPPPRRRARGRRYNRAVSVKSCKTTSRFEGGGRGQVGEWGELALTGKKQLASYYLISPHPRWMFEVETHVF